MVKIDGFDEMEFYKQQGWEMSLVTDKSFDASLNRLEGWYVDEATAHADDLLMPLPAGHVAYLDEEIRQAKAHHAEGSREDAWFHLLNVERAIARQGGRLQLAFEQSKAAKATVRAKKAGGKGGEARARSLSSAMGDLAQVLLTEHRKSNFRNMQDFERAAMSHSAMVGKGPDDSKWLDRLRKRSELLALIDELSRK